MYEGKGRSPLALASGSPRRKKLLESVGLKLAIIPADVEEVPDAGKSPVEESIRIALDKATWTALRLSPGGWVIAADTIVVVDNAILGKPLDEEDAVRMLGTISGREHRVITGWCVMRAPDEVIRKGYSESRVRIKALEERVMRAYVATGEPMDKAGSYAVQGIGAFMVESIRGSYTNVVGLPLSEVLEALEEAGAIGLANG